MEALYTAEAISAGGREGRVQHLGRRDRPALVDAQGAGRPSKPGTTNPEELFGAGYAARFENAMLRAARERKVRLEGSSVTPRGGIGRMENGRFTRKVDLAVTLKGIERAETEAMANAANEEICPYSRDARQYRRLGQRRLGRTGIMGLPAEPFTLCRPDTVSARDPQCRFRGLRTGR